MSPRLCLLVLGTCLLQACAAYRGPARDFDASELDAGKSWVVARGVPLVRQEGEDDCGAAALAMVLTYWDIPTTVASVTSSCIPEPGRGLTAITLRDYVRGHGMRAFVVKGSLDDLEKELAHRRPVIVGMVKPYLGGAVTHFEVVVALDADRRLVVTLDPARGWQQADFDGFLEEWAPAGNLALVVL